MYRGFIKCWRCAEDSRAWSRGALHRGVMLTILLKVAWKDCYYRGDELKAGQFAFPVRIWPRNASSVERRFCLSLMIWSRMDS